VCVVSCLLTRCEDSQVEYAAAVDDAEQAVRADLSALVAARSDAILSVQVRGGWLGSHSCSVGD
jgi:hypothetical protein